ncbi:hypothetical protein CTI16_01045 [Prevotella intermedia]|jgi:hypothetical protein|uniref:Uncharacterized protein n=1 Tax=Prevotella intermedia TaxID=28131 RepID=A0AAJ3RI98_PREIN|nr:hypothetical protein [Prevotella intermedia]ATV37887.1 hypothetical protein CUB95_04635 [Prevotella intermedia]PIK17782.1 hypothetical protein CTI16_01045 [Prevotella intermedia]
MEELLNDLIRQHFAASVIVILITIIALIILVWFVATMYNKIKNTPCDTHNKKLDELNNAISMRQAFPCETHQASISEHDKIVSKISVQLEYLTKSIDAAMRTFQKNNIQVDNFTQSQSPIKITDKGNEMIKRVGLNDMFENNWDRVKILYDASLKGMNPYDIQQFFIYEAVVFPDKFLGELEINTLKIDAYNEGIELASYMRVIAVLARDRYFKENGIDVNEIEKYE